MTEFDTAHMAAHDVSSKKKIDPLFWYSMIGLAIEGAAGEARSFVIPASYTSGTTDIALNYACCLLIALGFLAITFKKRDSFAFKNRVWGIASATVFSLGLCVYYQERLFVGSVSQICLIGQDLSIIAGYLYMLVWFDRIFSFGARNSLFIIGGSLIMRGSVQILLLFLQQTPSTALLVVLPVASLFCYLKVFKGTCSDDFLQSKQDNMHYKLANLDSMKGRIALIALLVLVAMISFSVTANSQRMLMLEDETTLVKQICCVLANLIAGGVILFFAKQELGRSDMLVTILVILGLLCFGLYASTTTGHFGVVACPISLSIARKMVDMLVVIPAFSFSELGSCMFGRHIVARLISSTSIFLGEIAFRNIFFLGQEGLNIVTSVSLLVLFLGAILFFACAIPRPEVIVQFTEANIPQMHRPFREALDLIAKEAGLTPTEAVVFQLIAKGHNADSVRQELVVSVNTAKTHIRNIYSKLNIHSQQELLAIVDSKKREIMEEYSERQ